MRVGNSGSKEGPAHGNVKPVLRPITAYLRQGVLGWQPVAGERIISGLPVTYDRGASAGRHGGGGVTAGVTRRSEPSVMCTNISGDGAG